MKKFLFIAAAAAALLTACQVKEELAQDSKVAVADEGIKFDVYTLRDVNTKGGVPGTVDNTNIGTRGFGVFAYYTNGERYDQNAKPNFMYNQQVTKPGDKWTYEPVKYWPNEYGSAAVSDEIDYVTFFAYAPWVEFEPTTGAVAIPQGMTDAAKIENWQKYNIVSVNKNSATGDPVIKYVVDTDPATSVDLLWGVAAQDATSKYSAIAEQSEAGVTVTPGKPFIDLVKPSDPKNGKLNFNLRHSLAKVQFKIDYIADDFTPDGTSEQIDSTKTRIFVRSFTMDGWALQGALNLNNEIENKPNWKDIDGVKELTFDALEFNDGRKDGKEGTANGAQSNEKNADRLNPILVENHYADVASNYSFGDETKKNIGVSKKARPLFKYTEGAENENSFFYVIPRDNNEPVNMTIVYDVETIDKNLASYLSDGATHGISIENKISKEAVLGAGTDIEAGKQYLFLIHIGMTSVKVEAIVTDWYDDQNTIINLPDNQPTPYWTIEGSDMIFNYDPSAVWTPISTWEGIYNKAGFEANAAIGKYHENNPDEDRYNWNEHRWAWASDKVNDEWPDYCKQCWEGAIAANGARYPWCVVSLPTPFKGSIQLKYALNADTVLTVYPWGENPRTFSKGYGIASMAEEFQAAFAALDPAIDLGFRSNWVEYVYYAASPEDAYHSTTSWIMDRTTQVFPATLDFSKLTVSVKADPDTVTKHE